MNKSDNRKKSRGSSKPYNQVPGFLTKTYEILENPENHSIISWNPEGNAFIVKSINEFSDLLPKYFKHGNFASFVRQLNMYDFHKIRQDANENEFQHRLFLRGRKDLLGEIKRKNTEPSTNVIKEEEEQAPIRTRDPNQEKAIQNDIKKVLVEMDKMKSRMKFFETTTQTLAEQNNRLLDENRVLFSELVKNREKIEKRSDVIMMILYTIISPAAMKFLKRSFNGNPNFTDDSPANKNPDQGVVENAVSLTNDKYVQIDPERLRKLIATLFENGFNPESLFEAPGNANNKPNFFKNYPNDRENYTRGLFDNFDSNDKKLFELEHPDNNYKVQNRKLTNYPTRNGKTPDNNYLKYNEEGEQLGDFTRKMQKKDNSSINAFNSNKQRNTYQTRRSPSNPIKLESAHIEDDDDDIEHPLRLDQGDKSPLISSSPYRNVELYEPFEIEPKNSNKDSIDFRFPNFSPEISQDRQLDLSNFNHIDQPLQFPNHDHTSSSHEDQQESNNNQYSNEIDHMHDIFNSDDLL